MERLKGRGRVAAAVLVLALALPGNNAAHAQDPDKQWLADLRENVSGSVVSIERVEPRVERNPKLGYGVIISKAGYILTAGHVTPPHDCSGTARSGCDANDPARIFNTKKANIYVAKIDGKQTRLELIRSDLQLDVALLKFTPASDLNVAKIGDSDMVKDGSEIAAIFPKNEDNPYAEGHIKNLTGSWARFVTDANVVSGDSGAPVFDRHGLVVGMVQGGQEINAHGDRISGLNHITPINFARSLIEIAGAHVYRRVVEIEDRVDNISLSSVWEHISGGKRGEPGFNTAIFKYRQFSNDSKFPEELRGEIKLRYALVPERGASQSDQSATIVVTLESDRRSQDESGNFATVTGHYFVTNIMDEIRDGVCAFIRGYEEAAHTTVKSISWNDVRINIQIDGDRQPKTLYDLKLDEYEMTADQVQDEYGSPPCRKKG